LAPHPDGEAVSLSQLVGLRPEAWQGQEPSYARGPGWGKELQEQPALPRTVLPLDFFDIAVAAG